MGLFLGSLFCFTDSYDCFCNNTMLFWFLITVALWYCLKSGRIMPPALFIFFRIALTILGVYVSIYTFWIEICLKQVCFAIKEIEIIYVIKFIYFFALWILGLLSQSKNIQKFLHNCIYDFFCLNIWLIWNHFNIYWWIMGIL